MPSALWALRAHAHTVLWTEKCSYSITFYTTGKSLQVAYSYLLPLLTEIAATKDVFIENILK